MAKAPAPGESKIAQDGETRRAFLYLATGAVGAVGAVASVWTFIHQMNPSASVLALASTEVDISGIEVGQAITVVWRGKPVFVRHRTPLEIAEAEKAQIDFLPDPQSDTDRVKRREWLILVGVCTHLGCVPLSHKGDYQGWFCPCHGSHYDSSGRIRRGPAPKNLQVPKYTFINKNKILIG